MLFEHAVGTIIIERFKAFTVAYSCRLPAYLTNIVQQFLSLSFLLSSHCETVKIFIFLLDVNHNVI